MKMKRLRSENGVTLVELLAALVLISLVVLLINSVFLFTQNSAGSISKESDVQQDMLLAMKMMTRDIRSADQPKVIVVGGRKELVINETETYRFKNGELLKNQTPVAANLESFDVCHPPVGMFYPDTELKCDRNPDPDTELDTERIIIILEGPDNRSGNHRILTTEIIVRNVNDEETLP